MRERNKKEKRAKKRGTGLTTITPFNMDISDPIAAARSAFMNSDRISDFLVEGFALPRMSMPSTDLKDKGNAYEINAEMPGIDMKNIKMEITPSSITIEAKKETKNERRSKGVYSKQSSSLGYYKMLSFPHHVKADTVRSEYKNGILHIEVKKK